MIINPHMHGRISSAGQPNDPPCVVDESRARGRCAGQHQFTRIHNVYINRRCIDIHLSRGGQSNRTTALKHGPLLED